MGKPSMDNYSNNFVVTDNDVTDVDNGFRLNFTSENNLIENNTFAGTKLSVGWNSVGTGMEPCLKTTSSPAKCWLHRERLSRTTHLRRRRESGPVRLKAAPARAREREAIFRGCARNSGARKHEIHSARAAPATE
jgi:parallel beta-helix repeat protein